MCGSPQRPSGSAGLNGTGRRSQRLDSVEDRVGNLLLGGERDVMLRPPLDDQHFVLRALEADLRARDIVEDDRVGALPLELLPRSVDALTRLGGEADDRLTLPPARRQSGEDVLGRLQVELELRAPPGGSSRRPPRRPEIGGAAAMISTSADENSRSSAAVSSAAVSTSTRLTPGGAGRETFAATSVTSAPRRAALARPAQAHPTGRAIADEPNRIDRLAGPPADTRNRRPSHGPLGPGTARSIASSETPAPAAGRRRALRGEASAPSSGSITVTPRSRSVARFAWVAGSRYIRSFIAGATSRGAEQARKEVVTIESAIPASFAIVFADAGAIR